MSSLFWSLSVHSELKPQFLLLQQPCHHIWTGANNLHRALDCHNSQHGLQGTARGMRAHTLGRGWHAQCHGWEVTETGPRKICPEHAQKHRNMLIKESHWDPHRMSALHLTPSKKSRQTLRHPGQQNHLLVPHISVGIIAVSEVLAIRAFHPAVTEALIM